MLGAQANPQATRGNYVYQEGVSSVTSKSIQYLFRQRSVEIICNPDFPFQIAEPMPVHEK
jgi:hypothetical protein